MTDLRDRIVEAVEQDVSTQYYAVGSVEVEGIADAVLAVLADPPAEVIEQAAVATVEQFHTLPIAYQLDAAEDNVRVVLTAVFGGEQA